MSGVRLYGHGDSHLVVALPVSSPAGMRLETDPLRPESCVEVTV